MNRSLHGSTFTGSSSKHGSETLGNSLEAKDSWHVPLTLETATIPLLSQQVPEPLIHHDHSDSKSHKTESKPFVCQDNQSTLGKGKPSAVAQKSISPKVTKSLPSDCIVHLNRQFDLVHYSRSAPVE